MRTLKKKKKRIQTSESNRESELFDSSARSSLCLCLQAYFGDSSTSLHVYRDYASPSHSYLSIQRPLTPLEVRLGNGRMSEEQQQQQQCFLKRLI